MGQMIPPTIAILGGTGNLGSGLAQRIVATGHPLIIGSRDVDKARSMIATSGIAIPGAAVSAATNHDAARQCDIVILTVPFAQQAGLLQEIAPDLGSKLVIDTTVPLVPPKVSIVQLPPAGSAALTAVEALGGKGRLVTAFHNVSAAKLAKLEPIDADVLVFGEAEDCREAIAFIARLNIRAFHGGPLQNAVAVEAMTAVLIGINRRYKVEEGAGIRLTGIADDPRR
ncbi:NADPH-dependent F420 reductase [Hyphomicrobiales bacterium]|nr:NADPH-dependent F420 reductase [Hyphomicrobiales bacterium]CAH1692054.1 NADPH-dependent F420 reductase [Hyphomicrobiales bacterium]